MLKIHFHRLFFLSILMMFGTTSHAASLQDTQSITITDKQLTQYLQKKVGSENSYQIPHLLDVDYKILKLEGRIGDRPDRIQINGVFLADMETQEENSKGKITLEIEFKPEYSANDGNFFLRNFKVLKWNSSSRLQREQLKFLMPMIEAVAKTSLNMVPVYTLNEENPHQALVKKWVTKMTVQPGKLIFYIDANKIKQPS